MENFAILGIILVPLCVLGIFSTLKTNRTNYKSNSSGCLILKFPKIFLWVGVAGVIVSAAIITMFTIFSTELPHLIFYIAFEAVFIASIFIILKTSLFKVVLQGNTITVYNVFKKTYSFEFKEIISAKRELKGDQFNSERIVIKTSSGKKFNVTSHQSNYNEFSKKIKTNVSREHLSGFIIIDE